MHSAGTLSDGRGFASSWFFAINTLASWPESSLLGRARHCTRFSARGLGPRRAQTTNYVLAFAYLIRGYNVLEETFRHWVTLWVRPRSPLSAALFLSPPMPLIFPCASLCNCGILLLVYNINFAFYYIALYYVTFIYYSKILFVKRKKLIPSKDTLPLSPQLKESFREYAFVVFIMFYVYPVHKAYSNVARSPE